MNGNTIQNGARNFEKPCVDAASSATSATACAGTRGASVFEATIIAEAQTVITTPSANADLPRPSVVYTQSAGIGADMKTRVAAPASIAVASPRSENSIVRPSRAR